MSAERMMRLFDGYSRASGTHGMPELDPNGLKWGIKSTAKTLTKGPTLEMWKQHLAGERPLGVVPTRDDSTCLWGSIDVDKYDIDLSELIKRSEAAKLPLVPCKSKSGGLHLFLFTSEPVPAAVMQTTLRSMAATLGFCDSEIFPKQTKIGDGDSGNWMIMPYFGDDFGGRLKMQRGLKKTGAEQTLGEFLNFAEKKRVIHDELDALVIKGRNRERSSVDAPYGDGPPCLQALSGAGFPEGSRNNALFHIGVYLKKAHPTKWEEMLGDDNRNYMKPPLPNNEVEELRKSLRKKDYQYKCKEEPMASHCNSLLCCTRRFGVGDGDKIPVIVKLRKIKLEKPIWYVTIEGSKTEMKIEQFRDIMRHQLFIEQCGGQLNMIFPPMKQWVWSIALKEYITTIKEEEPSEDTTKAGEFSEILETFLTNRLRARHREDLLRDAPWEDEENGRHIFTMKALAKFLERDGMRGLSRNDIATLIRGLGGKPQQLTVKNKRGHYWWIPSKAIGRAPVLDTPEIPEEMM
jgi:hypothetical protein